MVEDINNISQQKNNREIRNLRQNRFFAKGVNAFPPLLILLTLVVQAFNASRAGTYWDYQGDHASAMLNLSWLKEGVSTSDPNFLHLAPYGRTLFYIQWIPAWFINPDFGIDLIGSPNWIAYQNIFYFFIYMIGIYSLTVWARKFTSLNPSYVALFFVWCFPTVAGYGLMNTKDIPVFAGAACALALSAFEYKSKSKKDLIRLFLLVNTSILFVVGVRPGAAFILIIVFTLQFLQTRDKFAYLRVIAMGIPTLVLCYFTSAAAKNYGIFWFWNTYKSSSKFSDWQGSMQLWGEEFSTPISRLYYLLVMASQIPLFLFFILVIFILHYFFKRSSFNLRFKENFDSIVRSPRILPPGLFALFSLQVLLTKPSLYDDARQVIFSWAFIMLSSILLLDYALKIIRSKVLLILLAFLISLPVLDSLKIAPYGYTYRNEIANLFEPNGFETDYWGISGKENSDWIKNNLPESLKVVSNPMVVFQTYVSGSSSISGDELPSSFIYQQIRRPYGVPEIFQECKILHVTSREQIFGPIMVMSKVRLCEGE